MSIEAVKIRETTLGTLSPGKVPLIGIRGNIDGHSSSINKSDNSKSSTPRNLET